ncbi:MAG: hypothetical protein ACRC1U_10460, partial [Vibrionaceae bacterium]
FCARRFPALAQNQALLPAQETSQEALKASVAPFSSSQAKLIDVDELVDLTVQYENSLTW